MHYLDFLDQDHRIEQHLINRGLALPLRKHRQKARNGTCHALSLNWLISLFDGLSIEAACQRLSGERAGQSAAVTQALQHQLAYQQISMFERRDLADDFDDEVLISDMSQRRLTTLSKVAPLSALNAEELGAGVTRTLAQCNLLLIILDPVLHTLAIGRDKCGKTALFDPNCGIVRLSEPAMTGVVMTALCAFYRPTNTVHVQAYGAAVQPQIPVV